MEIKNSITINNQVVHEIESHKGIVIYQDDEDIIYICTNGAVIYTMDVDAYSGEGGGCSINITKATK